MKRIQKICTIFLSCLLVMGIHASATNAVPYAEIDNGIFSDAISGTTAVGYTEFGWVTFQYSATYEETYTQMGSTATLTSRKTAWEVTPSRSNAPAIVETSPVVNHYDSNGQQVESFYMAPDSPIQLWTGSKTNVALATYNVTAGYKGSTGFGVTGSTVLFPFTQTLDINFNLYPL